MLAWLELLLLGDGDGDGERDPGLFSRFTSSGKLTALATGTAAGASSCGDGGLRVAVGD